MAGTQTQTAVTTWSIDPAHSEVEFAVKHMMITTVKGRFTDVKGTIVAHESDPSESSVEVTIDAASIDTRVADRDKHLRSADFFDVEQHPTISFRSTRIEGATDRVGESFRVTGELTIRGVTREVTLDATFEGRGEAMGSERASFSATTKIDRRDYDLKWNQALEAGGVLVSNDVKITATVQLIRE
jgi:polyisoprenoid-binding protein YceI